MCYLQFNKLSCRRKFIVKNKNKEQSTNIEQLNILKYIPEKNKLLFISNLDSFDIINNNEKDKNPKKKQRDNNKIIANTFKFICFFYFYF